MLLHGWGLHCGVWERILPALTAHFRVTALDLPGMGRSPLPAGDYDLDSLLASIRPALPAHGHLLGWSLGGVAALALAAREPERVRTVVTVGTTPRFPAAPDWPAAMASETLAEFAGALADDPRAALLRFLALTCQGGATARADLRRLREILEMYDQPAARALRGGLNILRDTDLRGELSALGVPLQMIFGEHDAIVPAAVQPWIARIAPSARLEVLREVGHAPLISTPEALAQTVLTFYRDHDLV